MTQERWFVVKAVFRSKAKGRPKKRNQYYKPGIVAIEERFVLVKAKNGQDSLKVGEREALKYCKAVTTINQYGQTVTKEYLGQIESYEIDGLPTHGSELFSAIESAPSSESKRAILSRKFSEQIAPDLAPLFIAGFISEKLESEFGSEWPREKKRGSHA